MAATEAIGGVYESFAAIADPPDFKRLAERVAQGFYVNVDVNRPEAAKYGLTIADVQQAVSSGMGGMNVAENIEGRERYPMNVRYQRDFRDNLDELRRVFIATPAGAQITFEQVAKISFSSGPVMVPPAPDQPRCRSPTARMASSWPRSTPSPVSCRCSRWRPTSR